MTVVGIDISLVILLPIKANTAARKSRGKTKNGVLTILENPVESMESSLKKRQKWKNLPIQLGLPLVSERGALHPLRDKGSKRISLTIDPQTDLGRIATRYFAVTIFQLKTAKLVKHNMPKLVIVQPSAANPQILEFVVAGVG